MREPLFIVGERVLTASLRAPLGPRSVCTIVRVLPVEDGRPIQYRIKSDTEPFERVVTQARLEVYANG